MTTIEPTYIYEKLCLPILDEIYFICYEHRTLFSELIKNGFCYINEDMLGYNHIKKAMIESGFRFSKEIDTNDSIFKNNKSLLSVMNPKMNQTKWIKVELF